MPSYGHLIHRKLRPSLKKKVNKNKYLNLDEQLRKSDDDLDLLILVSLTKRSKKKDLNTRKVAAIALYGYINTKESVANKITAVF